MSAVIKQRFWSFTFYDKVQKRKCKHNNNTYYGAKTYRNEILLDKKRYCKVSDIFECSLDLDIASQENDFNIAW